MSQVLSQGQDPDWVSIPILKFSHNTSPVGKGYTWTHVNYKNDLEFIVCKGRMINEYGNIQTQALMKIISGTEVFVSFRRYTVDLAWSDY